MEKPLFMNELRNEKTNNVSVRYRRLNSLGTNVSAQSDQSSTLRKVGSITINWAYNKDADQIVQMPRLICVFPRRTLIWLLLPCHGSFV